MKNTNIDTVPYTSNMGLGSFGSEFKGVVDRLFDSFWENPDFVFTRNWRPTHIEESKDDIYIEIEVPGFEKSQLSIQAENGTLKVTAKNSKTNFVRTFSYGNKVDVDRADISLKNGILYIRLPKTEAAKARTLEIK